MPTNISEALALKRTALDQANAHTTILLVSLIMALIVLILLFEVDGLAQAVELMGEIEF
jgi:hypothetical protein